MCGCGLVVGSGGFVVSVCWWCCFLFGVGLFGFVFCCGFEEVYLD